MGRRRHLGAGVHRPGDQADAGEDLAWAVSVDSTIVRAHQLTVRSPQKGAPDCEPDNHAIGRSRGRLTTKIHLAADGRCRPLAFVLTAGQAGDAPAFTDVMARLRVPRRRGRPRTRPDMVLADKTPHAAIGSSSCGEW
ncbi:transposase [Streptomyces sp. NBC_00009]|uniref:transposase n=1 Tax=Streptomyces sp. NBC_00009 TaxID=2975620 RepID=UPI00386C4727